MKYFKFFRGEINPTGSVRVVGAVRRLRATWTPEMAHDMVAYHDINAEEELMSLLNQEINEEIIRNLNNLGGNRA